MKNYIKYLFVSFVLSGSFFAQNITINLPSSNYSVSKKKCSQWPDSYPLCPAQYLQKDTSPVKPKNGNLYELDTDSYYYITLNGKQVVKDARLGKRDFVNKTSWTIHADGTDIIA